ncbi:MAG TPA: phosphate ABC transporter substrate-binding protein PstS [Polyangiaceae bacterium]|nr:phosphate ABC transporter substrate-binding protein PstS [Polyangiaceae bacterium]
MTKILIISLALFSLYGCRCGGDGDKPKAGVEAVARKPPEPVNLRGAGASFPQRLYAQWIAQYAQLRPSAQIDYQSSNSGAGLREMIVSAVDFGATDAPLDPGEFKSVPYPMTQVPTTLSAVALVHSVPGVAHLQLSPEALVGIYLGEIKKWNDAKIAADNPDVKLPDADVNAVFRSDPSGTTAAFTDYLSKVSDDFKHKVGSGKHVSWVTGLGAAGIQGVMGQLKTIPGAISYIGLPDVDAGGLTMVAVKNSAGEYIMPNIGAVASAAAGVALSETLGASITNSPAKGAYPICTYSYILLRSDRVNESKTRGVADFLWWAIHEGQRDAASLNYAPLPAQVVKQIEQRIKPLTSGEN